MNRIQVSGGAFQILRRFCAGRLIAPHPDPLPEGEGATSAALGQGLTQWLPPVGGWNHPRVNFLLRPRGENSPNTPWRLERLNRPMVLPLLGERAGVRASVPLNRHPALSLPERVQGESQPQPSASPPFAGTLSGGPHPQKLQQTPRRSAHSEGQRLGRRRQRLS